jgi:LmbE family N-acetylglucosaminyl deacetylase
MQPERQPLRVLCLGAHSDDIEIGAGASILSLCGTGRVVVRWVVFGAGGEREREARDSAAAFLQNAQAAVDVLGFSDSFFPAEAADIKRRFESLKADFAPDVIFTHRGDDWHQDHRVISELTWNTYRNHLILEYEIPKYDGDLGHPNVFMPVADDVRVQKSTLLMQMFATQRSKRWFTRETFDGLMRIRGIECASPTGYAEAFHVRKLLLEGAASPKSALAV